MYQLLADYFRYLQAERNLSPYTLRNYQSDLSHFLDFLDEEGLDPLGTDRQQFRRYLARLREDGVAGGSIARRVSTVHSFYRYLVREGRLEKDPLLGVRAPKRERRLPTFLPHEQVSALIRAAGDDTPHGLRDRALLELMYAAGVRLSEVVGVDLRDLDLAERTARVKGKGNKERIAFFGAAAEATLKLYLRDGRKRLLQRLEEPALFLNRDGGRLSTRSVQLIVRKYALRAGLDQRVWPHLLRHTFATHMLDGGAELRVVQELMGHASVSSTQIYLHVTEERQRQKYTEAFYNQVRLKAKERK
ncbi:MAG: tyrosine recombinase XerC [Chloroflexi bacterium]|nr:tyrosine recombinase XerC [Chloroflexota bacterium]